MSNCVRSLLSFSSSPFPSRTLCKCAHITHLCGLGHIPRHRHLCEDSREEIARVGRVGEDPRKDVGVDVGVVECSLKTASIKLVVRCVHMIS